jgi:hypothetical protein
VTAAAVARDAARTEAVETVPEEPADVADAMAEPAELASEADAYNAADEAVLDLVAAEMAAPDPDEAAEASASKPRAHVTEPPLIEPFVVASTPEPAMVDAWPRSSPPTLQTVTPTPPVEPSLGATILATGILPRPKPPASDPLAPIRRMSQAEKIAFFS